MNKKEFKASLFSKWMASNGYTAKLFAKKSKLAIETVYKILKGEPVYMTSAKKASKATKGEVPIESISVKERWVSLGLDQNNI